MQIITDPSQLYKSPSLRLSTAVGKRGLGELGFVPTMGALHDGHLSLIQKSKSENDITLVSIFVNPTQFGPTEDYTRYPRPREKDLELLQKAGVDIVFTPTPETLYPHGTDTTPLVTIPQLTQEYCGKSRPTHFQGVLSVVLRLFNIVRPTRAYFGEKDYQQLRLIQHMAQDLFLPIQVIGCPIIREPDGLALSSRNQYLTPQERTLAPALHKALQTGAQETDPTQIIKKVQENLPPEFKIDYIAITPKKDRILVAATLGTTRLIDNIALEPHS